LFCSASAHPSPSPLFPYTMLFRSPDGGSSAQYNLRLTVAVEVSHLQTARRWQSEEAQRYGIGERGGAQTAFGAYVSVDQDLVGGPLLENQVQPSVTIHIGNDGTDGGTVGAGDRCVEGRHPAQRTAAE